MLPQEGEGGVFLGTAGFLNEDGQLVILGLDFVQRQKGRARGEDGSLDDRVLGAVEAEEIAQPSAVDHLRLQANALLGVIAGDNAELVETAGVSE